MKKLWLIATSPPNLRLIILSAIAAVLFVTTGLDSTDYGGKTNDSAVSRPAPRATPRQWDSSLAYPAPGSTGAAATPGPFPVLPGASNANSAGNTDMNTASANPTAVPVNTAAANEAAPTPSGASPGMSPGTSPGASIGAALLQDGRYYQRNGDYATAVDKFRTVIAAYPDAVEAADAYLALAETYHLDRRFKIAIETLQEFLTRFPADERVNRALFSIANNYKALGEWGPASYYYEHYAARADLLRGYAYLNAGEGYFHAGDFTKAISSLEQVLSANLSRVPTVDATARIGDAHYWAGDYRAAVEWYRRALALARAASFKADLGYRVGKAYAAMGDLAQAKSAWGEVIENYPSTYYALQAVESLPSGANPPTHFHQGLVYYNNDRYDAAIAAFNEYLARYPDGEDVPRARYYIALSYRYNGDPAAALSRLDAVIGAYPSSSVAGDALWHSGRVAESLSRFEEAIGRYDRVAREYPGSQYARDAIFRKGLCEYKLANLDGARATWGSLVTGGATEGAAGDASESVSRANFWLGRLYLARGEQGTADGYLRAAAAGDDFYAARAAALLEGGPSFGPGQGAGSALLPLPWRGLAGDATAESAERNEFEQWLSLWSGRSGYSYDERNPALRGDPSFRRAEELKRVGSWSEARDEFVELRERYSQDPVALYELAMFFRQNGMYFSSIGTALRIADLAAEQGLEGAPRFLRKLIYPVYYAELLEAEARKYGIDPLLLAALIRQESVFDQNAESGAGAKGLAQVMPGTGRGIAEQLGMESFADDDLFKPYVSAAFGAWYLWNQLNAFDNNGFHALAAYNAGGANAGKWIDNRTRQDDDLFVEEIAFGETQTYVKSVYRQYTEYKKLYGR